MILIRAKILSETTIAMAEELTEISGEEIAFILDGRYPVTQQTSYPLVLLTREACSSLGLYCPPDFPWRCGDYGVYLARHRFPDVEHFWLLDHDIRIAGERPSLFFDTFRRRPEIDFLATSYGPAGPDWDWYFHASGRDIKTFRCLFSIIRLSTRAIDCLLTKRADQGKAIQRRKLVPNDEGFVATTLSNGSFVCADFNSFGQDFYSDRTVSIDVQIRGETFKPVVPEPMIYHPVLFGADYERGNPSSFSKPRYGVVGALKQMFWRRVVAMSRW